jgi:hypothetical protein
VWLGGTFTGAVGETCQKRGHRSISVYIKYLAVGILTKHEQTFHKTGRIKSNIQRKGRVSVWKLRGEVDGFEWSGAVQNDRFIMYLGGGSNASERL